MPTFRCNFPATIPTKSQGTVAFHPESDASHRRALDRLIANYKSSHPEAANAELESIDADNHVAILSDRTVMSVNGDDRRKVVNLLASQCKPGAGEQVDDYWSRQYPGFHMVEFHSYEGQAIFERLSKEQVRTRNIIASKLGIKPWQVRVARARDGGWKCRLDKEIIYQPSKHDKAMDEACVLVGRPGWWFEADSKTGVIDVHPGEPPTFPATVPFPFDELKAADVLKTPVGVLPARPGEELKTLWMNWKESMGMSILGLSGSGKAQPLTARIPVPVSDRFPEGWATMGELEEGDLVYTRDGRTAPILSFSDTVEREVWKVTFSDGQSVECAEDHLWKVTDAVTRAHGDCRTLEGGRARGDGRVLKTREDIARWTRMLDETEPGTRTSASALAALLHVGYASLLRIIHRHGLEHDRYGYDRRRVLRAVILERSRMIAPDGVWGRKGERTVDTRTLREGLHAGRGDNWAIRLPEPFDGPDLPLPLEPYLLGCWLGDGISRRGGICLNLDDEPFIEAELEREAGVSVRRDEPGRGSVTHHYDMPDGETMSAALRRMDLLGGKRIPGGYLRASLAQRLSLLQGIMDTDGSVNPHGTCELCLTNRRLAEDALELVRSLGVKASMRESEACITQPDGSRRYVSQRWRIHFTTVRPVFRLPRKRGLLPSRVRTTQGRLYVTQVENTHKTAPMRCLRLGTDDHMYLTGGFVPTHNSVTINNIITSQLAAGVELYVIDHPVKSTDYDFLKPWVARKGWGCESLLQAAGLVKMLLDDIEEGGERFELFRRYGWANMNAVPEDMRPKVKYRLLVVDELSQLTVGAKDAGSLSKKASAPQVEKALEGQTRAYILSNLIKLSQIGRAYGIHLIVATQYASAKTGMPQELKGNLGGKILLGARPNKNQKALAFNNADDVPAVPEAAVRDGVSKGSGSSEFEGQTAVAFKSYWPGRHGYTDQQALGQALIGLLGLPEGIGGDEYMASFDQSRPIDRDYQSKLMDRIDFPKEEAYARLPYLRMLHDQLEEALLEMGGGMPEPSGEPVEPKAPTPAGPDVRPAGSGSPLMDAGQLARLMEG